MRRFRGPEENFLVTKRSSLEKKLIANAKKSFFPTDINGLKLFLCALHLVYCVCPFQIF